MVEWSISDKAENTSEWQKYLTRYFSWEEMYWSQMKDNRRVIIVMNNKEPSLENYQKGNKYTSKD